MPDQLVVELGIKADHIANEAVINRHIAVDEIEVKKTKLESHPVRSSGPLLRTKYLLVLSLHYNLIFSRNLYIYL